MINDLSMFGQINNNDLYKKNTEKIGNSVNNIKVINNFIQNVVCQNLINEISKMSPNKTIKQWEGMEYSFNYPEICRSIIDLMNQNYDVNLIQINAPTMVKWETGKKMDLHTDDFGIPKYHISAILYLNDDYDGGEIIFPTHDLTIKPKRGDLVMFPGNKSYPHLVSEIRTGTRYTVPVWGKYVHR